MTRVVVTPAILRILVAAAVAGVLPAGCSSKTAIGQQKIDAQAPGLDAPAGSGGAAGAGSDAGAAGSGGSAAGGVIAGGGVTASGGIAPAGGSTGAGGAMQTGGSTGTGGATQTGGTTTSGGSTADGGTMTSGGSTAAGGAAGAGGTVTNGGSIAAGGATKTGGTTGPGGTKSATGGTGGVACTGSVCPPVDAGCTGSGCSKDAGTTDAAVTPTFCPQTPPANVSSCGSGSLTCFYDNCPSGGRTQAVCAGGIWTVQTAACGAVTCEPDPSGSAHTCLSGQVCIMTNVGTIQYSCISNTCNQSPVVQNPISAQCNNMSACSAHYSLTNGVTFTCTTYTCPPYCV